MSAWLDISLSLENSLPPWPGDKPFRREITSEIGVNNSPCTVSTLFMNAHCGTHMDAPKHFVAGGAAIDELDIELLIGPAYLLDLTGLSAHITEEDLKDRIPAGVKHLLIKTRNSALAGDGIFHTDFIGLAQSAALYLAQRGIQLLAVDYYSIEPYHLHGEVHRAFLSAKGAIVLENVNLSKAGEGWYDLVCLPLPVVGGDGAPARALIRKMEA
jgi:arylformamidase